MRRTVLAFGLALFCWAPAVAQESSPERAATADAGIRAVIEAQMQAFRAGDTGAAFSHASPMIQRMFGGVDGFGRMVSGQYPMIWQPGDVRFLGLRQERGVPMQRIMLKDSGGALHLFDYEMTESGGVWRINGVFPVEGETGA
ncbi:DUF4864 domain-containing protein [Frigidibacter sp.]|uniref:DUF4864 domain-containing protein n=1 Tax=Frigidibacter sp. TaxID=2586418 RepID=UPI00273539B1|nr:DUF4864 domain-containing protein [Frigidibacter sp.]MDP3338868.1 DUF4864 domain-containing protein [Frigidibacter sp.]